HSPKIFEGLLLRSPERRWVWGAPMGDDGACRPYWTGFPGMVANRDHKIERHFKELCDRLGTGFLAANLVALAQDTKRVWINFAPGVCACAVGLEGFLAPLSQEELAENAARGISSAQKQHFEGCNRGHAVVRRDG